ncbi:MAG: ACP synthase [Myxococcota bacterium]|jgi:hypothetical protein
MNAVVSHPSELKLRALLAGEPVDEALKAHAAACATCQARLEGFQEEQARFEAEIPFERFAAGVERAARTPRKTPWRPMASHNVRFALAIAASFVALVGVQRLAGAPDSPTRPKGGADVEVVVAGSHGGPQRLASADPSTPEALGPGERVRVGLKAGPWTYAVVVSVDEAGAVSPVYDAGGHSLALARTADTQFLPDSLEFTGKGLERVIVVLSDRPLSLDEVTAAAKARYEAAHGDLTHLAPLEIEGEQFHRTFLKP